MVADEFEDRMLAAAEQLPDEELLAFANFVREQTAIAVKNGDGDVRFDERGNLVVAWYREQLDSNWISNERISVGPLDLIECIGGWAAKMKSLGIFVDDVKERSCKYPCIWLTGLSSPSSEARQRHRGRRARNVCRPLE